MPHRQLMSPRDGAAVADDRLVWTMRRSTSAARSPGRVESCLNRLIGRLGPPQRIQEIRSDPEKSIGSMTYIPHCEDDGDLPLASELRSDSLRSPFSQLRGITLSMHTLSMQTLIFICYHLCSFTISCPATLQRSKLVFSRGTKHSTRKRVVLHA
jgi:hypothetical protein